MLQHRGRPDRHERDLGVLLRTSEAKAMDPVSPVAQLAVAAFSGAAFLISVAVMPFPQVKTDSSAGISLPSQTATMTSTPRNDVFTPVVK
jgi:hypothetical protein